jgi:outer membrane protein assembly factor BamD (BamD/ComL family)
MSDAQKYMNGLRFETFVSQFSKSNFAQDASDFIDYIDAVYRCGSKGKARSIERFMEQRERNENITRRSA